MKGYMFTAVAVAVTLTCCVQMGAVTKIGPDKYHVTALAALEEAKKYCASMNKEIFVVIEQPSDEYEEASEVIFHCLDKDD